MNPYVRLAQAILAPECTHQNSTHLSTRVDGAMINRCEDCGLVWLPGTDFELPASAFLTEEELNALDFHVTRLSALSDGGH